MPRGSLGTASLPVRNLEQQLAHAISRIEPSFDPDGPAGYKYITRDILVNEEILASDPASRAQRAQRHVNAPPQYGYVQLEGEDVRYQGIPDWWTSLPPQSQHDHEDQFSRVDSDNESCSSHSPGFTPDASVDGVVHGGDKIPPPPPQSASFGLPSSAVSVMSARVVDPIQPTMGTAVVAHLEPTQGPEVKVITAAKPAERL